MLCLNYKQIYLKFLEGQAGKISGAPVYQIAAVFIMLIILIIIITWLYSNPAQITSAFEKGFDMIGSVFEGW